LARRFAQLETRLDKKLTEHDQQIAAILSAIRQLMHPPTPKRRDCRNREPDLRLVNIGRRGRIELSDRHAT
jgi:hypothetical protein